jgi:hypothetical protein
MHIKAMTLDLSFRSQHTKILIIDSLTFIPYRLNPSDVMPPMEKHSRAFLRQYDCQDAVTHPIRASKGVLAGAKRAKPLTRLSKTVAGKIIPLAISVKRLFAS